MTVERFSLDALREELGQLSKQEFAQRYPGAFLLAMGFLAVEKIRAATSRPASVGGRLDPTASVVFGSKLRHDAAQSHPLAGAAFLMHPPQGGQEILIGRASECDIVIPDSSVSQKHCRIRVTDEGVLAEDMGSTNGTTVNLLRLEPHQPRVLADEDILTIGRYSFQLISSGTFFDELSLLLAVDRCEE